jgi:polysaccharide export outer membrane protein
MVVLAQTPESLLIGKGDVLHVVVFDTPELEEHARVSDSGMLQLVVGGPVKVEGLTPADAGHAIEQVLIDGKYLTHPHVIVTVDEYTTQKVSVLGEVRNPGTYPIVTSRSVIDVLSMAGGLTENADRKVMIQRKGSQEQIPYFVSNTSKTALDSAVQIYPGDTLVVPKAGVVYMLGDVGHPGGYMMTNNETQVSALELLARAGGTTHSAVPSRAKLIRKSNDGYVSSPLPLSAMQKGKVADVMLRPDDIVYVPFSYLRNFALNASGLAASVGAAALYHF